MAKVSDLQALMERRRFIHGPLVERRLRWVRTPSGRVHHVDAACGRVAGRPTVAVTAPAAEVAGSLCGDCFPRIDREIASYVAGAWTIEPALRKFDETSAALDDPDVPASWDAAGAHWLSVQLLQRWRFPFGAHPELAESLRTLRVEAGVRIGAYCASLGEEAGKVQLRNAALQLLDRGLATRAAEAELGMDPNLLFCPRHGRVPTWDGAIEKLEDAWAGAIYRGASAEDAYGVALAVGMTMWVGEVPGSAPLRLAFTNAEFPRPDDWVETEHVEGCRRAVRAACSAWETQVHDDVAGVGSDTLRLVALPLYLEGAETHSLMGTGTAYRAAGLLLRYGAVMHDGRALVAVPGLVARRLSRRAHRSEYWCHDLGEVDPGDTVEVYATALRLSETAQPQAVHQLAEAVSDARLVFQTPGGRTSS